MNIVYKSIKYSFRVIAFPAVVITLIYLFIYNFIRCKDYAMWKIWCSGDIEAMIRFYKWNNN